MIGIKLIEPIKPPLAVTLPNQCSYSSLFPVNSYWFSYLENVFRSRCHSLKLPLAVIVRLEVM